MQPIIAGIDPGTTVGYAVLDFNGSVLESGSGSLSLNELTRKIYLHGKPLAVGCDKRNVPSLVREFCAKTGARLFSPYDDLDFEDKKNLVKIETKNSHEFDALASAVFAFNRLKVKIQKITRFCSEKNLPINKIAESVIKGKLNLIEAYDRATKKDIIILKKRTKQDINVQKLIDGNERLHQSNDELKEIIDRLKKNIKKLSDRQMKTPSKKIVSDMTPVLKEKERQIELLKHENSLLNEFLCERQNFVVKKFKDLNNIDVKDKVIIVDNPQNFSEKSVKELEESLAYIISDNLAKLPFLIVKKKGLVIKESREFALIDRKEFEKRVDKKELLNKIVSEYRSSRNNSFRS